MTDFFFAQREQGQAAATAAFFSSPTFPTFPARRCPMSRCPLHLIEPYFIIKSHLAVVVQVRRQSRHGGSRATPCGRQTGAKSASRGSFP